MFIIGAISNRSNIMNFQSKCHQCSHCMSLLCSSFISGIKSLAFLSDASSPTRAICIHIYICIYIYVYIRTINGRTRRKVHGNWARLASDDRRSSCFHSMPFILDFNTTAPPAYALFDTLIGRKWCTKRVWWKCRSQWKQQAQQEVA